MVDYLANRSVPAVAAAEFLAVQASYNWLVRNWEILGDIGLRYSGPLISEAQKFIDAAKDNQSNATE